MFLRAGLSHQRDRPGRAEKRAETKYWRGRYAAENGRLKNDHYEPLYTTVFENRDERGLPRQAHARHRLRAARQPGLADVAAQRVGLDVLADAYRREIGANRHSMEYRSTGSEKILFGDGYFDFVTSLNSLDHVDDITATILEIKRVTKPGGLFLLSVETDHPPTPAEPITVDDALLAVCPDFTADVSASACRRITTCTAPCGGARPPMSSDAPEFYVGKFRRTPTLFRALLPGDALVGRTEHDRTRRPVVRQHRRPPGRNRWQRQQIGDEAEALASGSVERRWCETQP